MSTSNSRVTTNNNSSSGGSGSGRNSLNNNVAIGGSGADQRYPPSMNNPFDTDYYSTYNANLSSSQNPLQSRSILTSSGTSGGSGGSMGRQQQQQPLLTSSILQHRGSIGPSSSTSSTSSSTSSSFQYQDNMISAHPSYLTTSSTASPPSILSSSPPTILSTKKILSRRPSLNTVSSTTTSTTTTTVDRVASLPKQLDMRPSPLRIGTGGSSTSGFPSVSYSSSPQQQQFLGQPISQQQIQQLSSSSPELTIEPTSPVASPTINQLRSGTPASVRFPKKPKKSAKTLALKKLTVPAKKNSEYEITNSGTFKFAGVQIAPYGMKTSTQTPSSSNSAHWTPSPITPEQYFQQPIGSRPGSLTTSSVTLPSTNAGNSIQVHKSQLEQLEMQFARMSSSGSSPELKLQQQPSRLSLGATDFIEASDYDDTPTSNTSTGSSTVTGGSIVSSSSQAIAYDSLHMGKKSKLGSGASATVHRVTHVLDGKPYALKIVPLFDRDIQPKQIISEIRSLYESMECPYVVRFYEAFHREGGIRILLEYMDCGSLEDVYKTVGKMPEDVLSVISYQILSGLDYLEKKKIIHRDIKPSNILLNKEGMAKISDFGMSKQLTAQIQAFKTFIGTYVYMSPERLKGDEHSFESDIWSLGVSIAECAVGQFPFDVKQLGVFDVLNYITEHGLDVTTNQVSPELLDFLKKTTIVDPKLRPTAAELLQHPWILKYHTSPNFTDIAAKWLNDVYRPERKRKHQLKHMLNPKRKNSTDGKSHDKKSPRSEKKP